jgi:hypothetical protein
MDQRLEGYIDQFRKAEAEMERLKEEAISAGNIAKGLERSWCEAIRDRDKAKNNMLQYMVTGDDPFPF